MMNPAEFANIANSEEHFWWYRGMREIMFRLQESGVAVPSDTMLDGRHALRVAVVNHRTREADLDLLVDAVLRLGAEIEDASATAA